MNTSKATTWVAVVALIIAIAGSATAILVNRPHQISQSGLVGAAGNMLAEQYEPYVQYNGGFNTNLPMTVGNTLTPTTLAVTGASTFTGQTTANNAVVYGGTLSTTTLGSETMQQSDLTSYNTIVMTPTTGSLTVTLPATSTLTSFIPTSGQSTEIFWLNASTTASQNITVSGGTGMNMVLASSTATSVVIKPKSSALFRFIRQPNTDISVLMIAGFQ